MTEAELAELQAATAQLTYGSPRTLVKDNPNHTEFLPAHVAFDKKVMAFDAYIQQPFPDSTSGEQCVRYVKIYYYIEDDTISVLEPEVPNSGLLQGKMLKRQRVPKNTNGDNYVATDLNLGQTVTFYGTAYRITDCNEWSKNYLQSKGVVLNAPEVAPRDTYLQSRQAIDKPDTTYHTPSDFDKLKQFIALDRRVLKFYAVWDDGVAAGSGRRPFIIHYFLVDNTLEVRELHEANDGRDPFPVLITRRKMPRDYTAVPEDFPTIIMEVPAGGANGILDLINPSDFALGATVNIYGREFFIYDCDEFTKEFYRLNFGVTDFTPVDVSRPPPPSPAKVLPPPTGYGSHADSMGSCLALVPRVPKNECLKLLQFDNKSLRFLAHMANGRYEDSERRFIISYYLASDTLSIWETTTRNSGFLPGQYLKNGKVETPTSDPKEPSYYTLRDFACGTTIVVHRMPFVIDGADKFVLEYMAANPDSFEPSQLQSFQPSPGK